MDNIPAGKVTSGGDSGQPSPKKTFNPIGTESQWSFGWQGNNKDIFNGSNNSKGNSSSSQGFNLYHNTSSIVFGDTKASWKEQKVVENKKKRDPVDTKPVWNYDPKKAGKTTVILGD